jgi:hypothetical protein
VKARRRAPLDAEMQEVAALILADYRHFLFGGQQMEDGVAKAFSARHTAGRAALAHLELALKLAGDTENEAAARRISDDLSTWRKRIPASPKEEPEPDDDGSGG